METVVVVAQDRNQYNGGKATRHGDGRFVSSSPSQGFKGMNCRGSYQSGLGLLPTPSKSCSTPVAKQGPSASYSSSSPQTPSPCASPDHPKNSNPKPASRSVPIPINSKGSNRSRSFTEEVCVETFAYSELWAGPAYSNSPPPSSLPIPKFSMRPKRTVSLELPVADRDIKFHPIAKSAPTSPTTREHNSFTREVFHNADFATQTLRRILNLDIADE